MIEVIPIDFLGQGAMLEPKDVKLHDAAVEFALRNLRDGDKLNFATFAKVWVGLKDGEVKGLAGYVLRPDVPLFRATDCEVLRALGHRLNEFFADNGCRKQEAFVLVGNEPEAERCPAWRQVLKEFGARSARRVAIEVR